MRHAQDHLLLAIGELQCIQDGSPATLSELSALAIAQREIDDLLRACVQELRTDPKQPRSWSEITGAVQSDSTNAVKKRFSVSTAIELEQVAAFWTDHSEQFAWDFLPNGFLYALYRAWPQATGRGLSKETFMRRLIAVAVDSGRWEHIRSRPGSRMQASEPLVRTAKTWSHNGADSRALWGLRRVAPAAVTTPPTSADIPNRETHD